MCPQIPIRSGPSALREPGAKDYGNEDDNCPIQQRRFSRRSEIPEEAWYLFLYGSQLGGRHWRLLDG